ncbi:MAG: hypothetical protein FWC40_04610 [Proteobacteria bacterium]|nr:hypothetical protein [Pseudomonadota bacterium]
MNTKPCPSPVACRLWALACLLIALMLCACSKESSKLSPESPTESRKLQTHKLDLSGLVVETLDINQDGIPDQWRYSTKEGQLRYVLRDINFDGIIDMIEFHENSQHVRDEIDLDFDGICDLIITYQDGRVVLKDYSPDFKGYRYGQQIFDSQGHRIEVRRDTNGDGTFDTVEHYRPGEEEPYRIDNITR